MQKNFRLTVLCFIVCLASLDASAQTIISNSLGMKMIKIEPGTFTMGQGEGGNWDEVPLHKVTISKPFYMAATEVNNAQYELFDPKHRAFRGEKGLSEHDDEAALFISWLDAVAFCEWLSKKEGKTYRLPTEAEWEFVCRAETTTQYHTGDNLPGQYVKNLKKKSESALVSLRMGQTPPNAWGLFDMHGNVEEWCLDWYGPYSSEPQTDPAGRREGDFRVLRGGSHSTEARFLRSANRMGALPEDKHQLIGFRVVMGDAPSTKPLSKPETPMWAREVDQTVCKWSGGPDPAKAYFRGPLRYVNIPAGSNGPIYSTHNHDPGLAYCPNGDLLAIWYTCNTETGRELAIVASRLRRGAKEWDPPSPFWDAPDRNDHAPALWHDGQGILYHFNGLSFGRAYRENLALVMRVSKDNGCTWSKARLINPERGLPSQPVTTVFRTHTGRIILPVDAPSYMEGGATALWASDDNGATWAVTDTGPTGIHAGVAQLKDGRLLSFGRYKKTEAEYMPKSVSHDMGKTWTRSDSVFPPISGGQRLVLTRLREGPLLLVAFTDFRPVALKGAAPKGMLVKDASGKKRRVYGLYGALSFDDGETWPVKKLITPGGPPRELDGGAHTDLFTMDKTHAEPAGYLAATQTPDGVIHLIASALHYQFNVAWLKTPMPAEHE